MDVARIQQELARQGLDGWLFFDHHERDPLAYRILGFTPSRHVTRRWYYLIPVIGEPRALVHRIESQMLAGLPGATFTYASWQDQQTGLQNVLNGINKVAMQYSPRCEIPYVSLVDAGTIELVRQIGCDVVTSSELIQYFEASLNQEGLRTHLEAGKRVDSVRAEAFQFIGERLRAGSSVNEFQVAAFVRQKFTDLGLYSGSGPIVGVNENAGNPHYEPIEGHSNSIKPGDFVLLDMWAKLAAPESVYYDITWTGFCGADVPDRIQNVFTIVRDARDAAIRKVETSFRSDDGLRGFEVDDAARSHIAGSGFADNFIHRTGHSIGSEVHGNGANMDNFEIHDERKLIPWTCFSIEPGIYLEDFGVRSEVNMFITDSRAIVTGAVQRELVLIR
ncbi:MAG: aminopeptidase P family protein [Acidobacteriota bacterium]|nr:aminopeptidase P family protein [Acidobacteriota bacterium]